MSGEERQRGVLGDWLSEDELRGLSQRSNVRGAGMLAANWLLIALVFIVVGNWLNPLTFVVGALLLGGRQLGLAILMHEAGHQTLFRSATLNRVAGQWLCAYPILADVEAYARSHRDHHRLAGTHDDPDLPNYQAYPVSVASFRRKLWRDLSGQTGIKTLAGMFTGRSSNVMMRADESASRLPQGLIVNVLLLAALVVLDGWVAGSLLFSMWVVAYVVFYPAVARIRQLAEHGHVLDLYDADPRNHTRTVMANGLERLVLCPNRVNYHLEHHFAPAVPAWRLPALHRLLTERGFFDKHPGALEKGYWPVLRRTVPDLAPVARAAG